ncbi:hypothetical protein F441_15101 [Phytophthora nicotianae CJ01A1]|uniref:Uncharacterized protein n=1 Tax=Phytophthora nicotianae CJ01A1 TaxID=1317063 RepID=W2WFX0_PHYNI|nr:hypothetical protein F441_15101 [Phytophthora nicotianae CJ01A1]
MDELLVNALIDMALASWERPRKDSAVREFRSDGIDAEAWNVELFGATGGSMDELRSTGVLGVPPSRL